MQQKSGRNILLKIAYDGTGYIGWQRQPKWRGTSVQQQLEQAISRALSEPVSLFGSGRTDAGVHALAQYANFFTEKSIPCSKLVFAVNNLLPSSIRVLLAREVAADFSARFSAHEKTYRYTIVSAPPSIFTARYVWQRPPLDLEKMQSAAQILVGAHDFAAFTVKGYSSESTVRCVSAAKVFSVPDISAQKSFLGNRISPKNYEHNGAVLSGEENFLGFPWQSLPAAVVIEVTANGFLYKMMRLIAARLVKVGLVAQPVSQIESLLGGKTLPPVPPAPPHGLMLLNVDYGDLLNT